MKQDEAIDLFKALLFFLLSMILVYATGSGAAEPPKILDALLTDADTVQLAYLDLTKQAFTATGREPPMIGNPKTMTFCTHDKMGDSI